MNKKLKKLIDKSGLTIAEVARRSGVRPGNLHRIIADETISPMFYTIDWLAGVLGEEVHECFAPSPTSSGPFADKIKFDTNAGASPKKRGGVKEINECLCKIMDDCGKTVKAVAEEAGIDYCSLSRIRNDRSRTPIPAVRKALSRALGRNIDGCFDDLL